MSTVGKVLVVLVALAVIPAIFLYSMVSQLNSNWGKEIQRLDNEIARVHKETAETRLELNKTRAKIERSQTDRNNELQVLRTALSDVEKRQTLNFEQLERLSLQIATLQASLKDAQLSVTRRTQEKQKTEEDLAATRAANQTLRADVDAKFQELSNLRSTFKKISDENRALLQRLGQAGSGAPPAAVHTRPASLRH